MPYIVGTAKNSTDFYQRLKGFITGVGFIGQATFQGVGNGRMIDIRLPDMSFAADVYTVTCETTAPYGGSFGVESSIRGVRTDANVSSSYLDEGIEFYIDFGPTDFVLNDTFTVKFVEYSAISKPWISELKAGIATKTETITLTCVTPGVHGIPNVQAASPAVFSVEGSMSGPLGNYNQGELFMSSVVTLRVDRGNEGDAATQFTVGDTIKVFTTANELVALNQQWVTLREVPNATNPLLDTEWIFKGPGLAGVDEIFCGMQGFVLSGMRGYAPNLSYNEQPGMLPASERPSLSLRGSLTPYWITVTGRRIIVMVRNDNYYMSMYLGLGLPWGSPKYQPYLLLVGGSAKGAGWSTTSDNSANWWCPRTPTSYASLDTAQTNSQLKVLNRDGIWKGHLTNGWSTSFYSSDVEAVLPYSNGEISQYSYNLDGGFPMMPLILTPHLGEVDGAYAIPSIGFVSSEDIIYKPVEGRKFVVCSNTFRTGTYAALELK